MYVCRKKCLYHTDNNTLGRVERGQDCGSWSEGSVTFRNILFFLSGMFHLYV